MPPNTLPSSPGAIRSFLRDVARRLVRRDGLRVFLYLLTALAAAALVGPLLAAWAGEDKARHVLVLLAVVALIQLVGFVVLGLIAPRRRVRKDGDVARYVGRAAPEIASDLLSVVQLQPELARAEDPRFSRELAGALADDTAGRIARLDPEVLVPRRPLRRAWAWLAAAIAANAACLLLLPGPLVVGWTRLIGVVDADHHAPIATSIAEPIVGDIRLILTYPAYTGRPQLTVPSSSGDILALPGTKVELSTTALRPAARAQILIYPQSAPVGTPPTRRIDLAVAGKTLSAHLDIDKPQQYRFLLAPVEGEALIESDAHKIEVEPDHPPRVELIAPADELDVSSRKRIELAYNVEDDYGIKSIDLVWKGENGKEERMPLTATRPGARSAQSKFLWDLADVALAPGDRVAYHLEAKDNDDVGGSNLGVSKTYYLKVFSPRERHEQLVERQQQLFEESVAALGDRMESAAEDLDRRRALYGEGEKLVIDLSTLLPLLEQDTLAPKGLKAVLEEMRARLDKLVHDEQPLLADAEQKRAHVAGFVVPKTGPLLDAHKRAVPELERDVLELDDWLARQRVEDMLAVADELKQHRERLKDLIEQFKRTGDPKLRAEIDREMRAIEHLTAEMAQKQAQMPGEVADKFMNSEAMNADDQQDCMAKVRALLDAGDAAGAQKQLERCSRLEDKMSDSLESTLHGLRSERFSEEEKAFGELMSEIGDLEHEQRKLAGELDGLMDDYKQRAAEAAKQRTAPQAEKAKKIVDKLRKDVAEIPKAGLTPFAQEELEGVKQRVEDVAKMLDEGDVAEALQMARHAQQGLKTIGADIEDDLDDGHPWSDRTNEAEEKVAKAAPRAKELIDELSGAMPKPEDLMSDGDKQKLGELKRRQVSLRDRAQKLQQKTGKRKDLPGGSGEAAEEGLGQAGEQMGRAEERMDAPDPLGARDEATGAADKLADLKKKVDQKGRPSMARQGQGRDPDDEPVKIPGSDDFKPPEAFREDILDAMKKEKPPDAYKDQVKRYYEELVK